LNSHFYERSSALVWLMY